MRENNFTIGCNAIAQDIAFGYAPKRNYKPKRNEVSTENLIFTSFTKKQNNLSSNGQ